MSSIELSGSQMHTRWSSGTGYEFQARLIGKGIYEGSAVGGTGSWTGATGNVGYYALNGLVQTDLMFKVEENHRLVRWELHHVDAGYADNAANYNLDVEYRTRGTGRWSTVHTAVPGVVNYQADFGETYERLQGQYRVRLQGTDGHFLFITPRIQTLKVDAFKGKGRNP